MVELPEGMECTNYDPKTRRVCGYTMRLGKRWFGWPAGATREDAREFGSEKEAVNYVMVECWPRTR